MLELHHNEQTVTVDSGSLRLAETELTKAALTKSIKTTDGFTEKNLKSTLVKYILIKKVLLNGTPEQNITVKMYTTDAADTVTTAEANSQFGVDIIYRKYSRVDPYDAILEIPNNKHITLVSTVPCVIETSILFSA